MLTTTFDSLPASARRHLYVTDLDGTFLDAEGRVSPQSARIVSELSHMGALITVATARTPATVDRLLQHTFTRLPAIVMTGAALWDRRHRRYIDPRPLSTEAATMAIAACREAGINPFIYSLAPDNVLDVWHNGTLSPKERRFVEDRQGLLLKRFHLDEPAGMAESFPLTMLLFAMGSAEVIHPVAERLAAESCMTVSSYPDNYNPQTAVLEVFAPGVSKAGAVRRMAAEYGATRVTVFGDNLNDLSMMKCADEAVAVANAQPLVIEQADVTIGPNTDDSVARYILDTING